MRNRILIVTALLLAGTGGAPSVAQSSVDGRVTRLESEVRAIQRKVFPGSTGQYLQPDIDATRDSGRDPEAGSGTPSASALADLTARVASLDGQMASLTGQVEQAGYRTRQVQESFDSYRRATDTRLSALEGGPPRPATNAGAGDPPGDEAAPPVARPTPRPTPTSRPTGGVTRPTPAATPAQRAPLADAARTARIAAVAKPATGNEVEDAYSYGYRLWQAKLYPEAQAQLKRAAAAGPANRRYTFAQNLLGRAYLDDGKPSLASMAFYDNYKKAPDGERAPESLYYLAQALVKLGKPADACKVYDELSDVYASRLGARMKADIATGRTTARCRATG